MRLASFNQLSALGAAILLEVCLPIPRWSDMIVAGLPYPVIDDLFEAARDAAYPFTTAEVDFAVGQLHPNTRELVDAVRRRPSGRHDTDVQGLEAAAFHYEDTFGQPVTLRTAGRSEREILHQIEQRLDNTPAQETRAIAHELRQIGLLQLANRVRP